MERQIPPGARCLTPEQTWAKFARKHAWGWDRLKQDPTFPRPIYIGKRPVFIEQELDLWLQAQANVPSAQRGSNQLLR